MAWALTQLALSPGHWSWAALESNVMPGYSKISGTMMHSQQADWIWDCIGSVTAGALSRPLVLGSRERNGKMEYCVASEDCAFGPIGFQRVRDVAPGEMLIVTGEQLQATAVMLQRRVCGTHANRGLARRLLVSAGFLSTCCGIAAWSMTEPFVPGH